MVSWRGDEDLLAHTASGMPLPVGGLEMRKYCGLSGDVDGTGHAARTGRRFWRGRRPTTGRSISVRRRPRRAIRRWRRAAWCFTCWCSGPWPQARRRWAARGSSRPATRLRDDATVWKRVSGAEEAISTDYSFHSRRLRGGRSAAGGQSIAGRRHWRRSWPIARVAELFRGLDFARVDDRAGSLSSLIQEIWRMFLVAMMVAMVAEAALCSAQAGAAAGGRGMNVSRSLTFLGTPWSVAAVDRGGRWPRRVFCYIAWRRSGYRHVDGAARAARGWRWWASSRSCSTSRNGSRSSVPRRSRRSRCCGTLRRAWTRATRFRPVTRPSQPARPRGTRRSRR